EASGFEPVAGLGPALLRAVPEGEQGFLAARLRAAAAELHHLIGLEEHALARGAELPRNGDERAVVAPVAAQPGEWDEDLAGVGDDPGSALVDESGVPAGRGECAEGVQILPARREEDGRLGGVERQAVCRTPKGAP